MHRSKNRDIYEARMAFNPEKKAEMLAKSPFCRHRKQVTRLLSAVDNAQKVVTQVQTVDTPDVQQGPL